jgi:hydroxymethylglutaryl-CoA reductase
MAVGVVGGVTKLHPTAQASLKIMGNPDASRLAQIVIATGLAQNLSALRALASEGIQRGHMGLHQKNLDLLHQRMQPTTSRN